ncbi:NAD(P)-binding domain-containing protein [Glutamicibacter sp.]|uniref:NADPH-dependent F420 reductase n=1 Tax=Glutamicibacter sp. TaxID=1931995 RepID=UPI0028BE9357|nr:NAD(P)-binding domain-containing protein [Glutamicibacter sp.]
MKIQRIGILGAGRAGTALARVAALSEIDVDIASTRTPQMMKYHLAQYAPQAHPVMAKDLARNAEVIVLMVPQEELDDVDRSMFSRSILIDATNRWHDEPVPAWFEDMLDAGLSSSEVVAARFAPARVVKAFNHISHWDLDADRTTRASGQRALGIASDDAAAAEITADLTTQLGFSPVILPNLKSGLILEPDGPVFNEVLDSAQLKKLMSS